MAYGAKWLSVLAAALIVCACGPEVSATPEDQGDREPVQLASHQVEPYVEAATVKLFVADAGGKIAEVRTLSSEDRAAFENSLKLEDYDRAPEAVAACFVPHHFFTYYDDKGAQIGEIQVCFCCGSTVSKPSILAPLTVGAEHQVLNVDFEVLASVLKDWGVESEIGCVD